MECQICFPPFTLQQRALTEKGTDFTSTLQIVLYLLFQIKRTQKETPRNFKAEFAHICPIMGYSRN